VNVCGNGVRALLIASVGVSGVCANSASHDVDSE